MLSNYKRENGDFYKTTYEYLFMRKETNASASVFCLEVTFRLAVWQKVEITCLYLKETGVKLNDSQLFNQTCNVKKIMIEKSIDLKNENMLCYEKLVNFVQSSEHAEEYSEILKICQYMFSIPRHNANIERIFSLMNVQRTKERNQLDVTTIESIIQMLTNYELNCQRFS